MGDARGGSGRPSARVGELLEGKWRLDALLGVGAMAAVYQATHRNGNRVAIKLLHPALCSNESGNHDESNPCGAAAEALFNEGREAMAAGAYDTACGKFQESDQIDPAPGTKLNLGECELRRGRIATAWKLFRAVAAQLPPADPRYAPAQQRAAELEPRLPRVVFGLLPGSPPNTTVRLGTAELGAGSFGLLLPVDPGTHRLAVRAPGHDARAFTLAIAEGERTEIKVGPGPKSAPAAPGPSGAAPGAAGPEPAPPSFWGRHKASVLVAGGAVLLGGVGLGLGAATSSSYADLAESCAGTAAGCARGDIDAAQGRAVAT
ncbi:MAG: hypothetical protein HY744_34475, partial [Deltaproteobacteria bacterium]|nr:hypothetical protein [Deltaproteobacteria bacterium]